LHGEAEWLGAALEDDDVCSRPTNVDDAEGRAIANHCAQRLLQLRATRAQELVEELSGGEANWTGPPSWAPTKEQIESAEELGDMDLGAMVASAGYKNHGPANIKTLYHQTSPEAGRSILKTGFRLGTSHAICGSAIYFSPSVSDTDPKAMGGRGFIVKSVVDIGRKMWMPRDCDYTMTETRLNMMGFDSINLDRGRYQECWRVAHCYEFIIYDNRRVLHMSGFAYKGWAHWYSPTLLSTSAFVFPEDASHEEWLALEPKHLEDYKVGAFTDDEILKL